MNSETPANPESENSETNFSEPAQSSDVPQSTERTEVTSDAVDDDWLEDEVLETSESQPSENSISQPQEFESPTSIAAEDTPQDSDSSKLSSSLDKPDKEPELFADTWLDEPEAPQEDDSVSFVPNDEIAQLKQQKADLEQEIAELKAHKEQMLLRQVQAAQENMGRMIEEGTKELRERKTALRYEIEKLEPRKERINQEMRSNFAGSAKELAIRVQGFKEYLVGSLQDLAAAADKLELARTEDSLPRNRERVRNQEDSVPRRKERERERSRSRERGRESARDRSRRSNETGRARGNSERATQAQFSEPTFADQSRRIRQLLDQYCNSPDYYGAPWQLRRTFDQNQARKVQEWFFTQGGRGAIDSMGSRLQNILVASAAISILHDLYRDRTQVLVLTDTPENLGEWRKGLEDCLGISRRDFGTNRGIVLFDSPDIMVQRAERLLADKLLPIIIIDETEELLNLSVLKFPIWLAFASKNKSASANYLY